MIRYAQGDIFDTPADIRVNTVNCVGVMGAGVALAFKNRYPEMFKKYAKACKSGKVRPGKPHVWKKSDFEEIVTVVNLPTKDHWKQPSEYEYVEKGLRWLHDFVEKRGKVRVALPALGCGHGGLDWPRVQKMIEAALGDLTAEIIVFEPSSSHAAGERLDQSTLARLEELGIQRLRSGDPAYPEALRGRSGATVYLKGDVESLIGPMIAVIPSIKPSEREIQGLLACVNELANPGVHILTGYSANADRPVIRTALEQGAHVIICLVEGILLFNIRRDLQDIWDEYRVTVISAAKPQQKWYPGGVGKATAVKLSLADVALISDPSPKWLSSFARNDTMGIRSKIFYLEYGGMQDDIMASLRKLQAKPLGRSRESGKPNVSEVLAALQPTDPPQQTSEIIPTAHEVDNQKSLLIEKTEGDAFLSYPKRLIEVDLPIKRISAHARREKSIRHGHISTLHIWWARRPLGACRAAVCASLWPDPADNICPQRFIESAKRLMRYWGERHLQKCSADSYPRFNKIVRIPDCLEDAKELRKALLDFIADFANWDNSTSAEYLAVARTLTVAAYDALEGNNTFTLPHSIGVKSLNDAIKDASRPLLVDPFAGGGALPLEGLRCGAEAFASDLNPVAVLLNKVLLEYIPKYGQRLADEVQNWGKWIKEQAKEELSEFYPKDEDGATPIAYLWARTITCEGPNCGITIPMINQLWIKKDGNPTYAFKFALKNKEIAITIQKNPKRTEVGRGTTVQGSVTCPACGYTNAANRVRAVGQAGGLGHRMIGVVLSIPGSTERRFRAPSDKDHEAFEKALSAHSEKKQEFSRLLNTEIPRTELRRVSVPLYGLNTFDALFLPRQKLAFDILLKLLKDAKKHNSNTDVGLNNATIDVIALAISNVLHYNMTLSTYLLNHMVSAFIQGTSLAMRSDFAEAYPLMDRLAGGLDYSLKQINRMISRMVECNPKGGTVARYSATSIGLPDDSVALVFTDPPYYDSIPYSHLSDLFYLWLKASIGNTHSNLFSSSLIEKESEIVEDRAHSQSPTQKNADFFEAEMQKAMAESRRIVATSQMQVVVFAHKSTEGWETMLLALIEAGWTVVAAWPIDTERPARMNAYQNASLLSSIHVACRPRENPDSSLRDEKGDWRDVLSELPERIAAWLPRLASEGVVGADAIFACIGPALEIFSRYSSVEKASGEVVPLREYLEQVWAEVARQALNMIFEDADARGFEEDARLTAMWLWTMRTSIDNGEESEDKNGKKKVVKGYSIEYDAARKIAQGLGVHLESLKHLVETKGDTATLLAANARVSYLFGKDTNEIPKGQKKKSNKQMLLFEEEIEEIEEKQGGLASELTGKPGTTVLDQLHQSMLLFGTGRGEALKRFLVEDGVGNNPMYWKLAQSLSALYPPLSEEKRWVDGVLARKKSLGF